MRPAAVTIATTVAQVEALRSRWSEFDMTNIDCDIDYFLTLVRNAENVISPYVVHIARDEGDLLLVARLEKQTLPLTVAYQKLATFDLTALVVAFEGFLGVRHAGDEAILVQSVRDGLEASGADIAVFQAVDVDGSLLAAARAALPWWRRSHWNQVAPRWKADVAGDPEDFFGRRSAKTRKRLQAKVRKLEGLYGSRMTMRRGSDFPQLAELFQDMDRVSALSYQRRLGVGFTDSTLDRAFIEFGLRTDTFRAWVLYVDGVAISHWSGTLHRGTFAIATPAFDPSYAKDSVGQYTMFRMVEDLCRDPSIRTMDFGFGDAEYKAAFGAVARNETKLIVAAGRLRPSTVVQLYSLAHLFNLGARNLVRRLPSGDRIKTLWRSRTGRSGRATDGAVEMQAPEGRS